MSFEVPKSQEHLHMGAIQAGPALTPGGAPNKLHLVKEDFDLEAVKLSGTVPAVWATLGLTAQDVAPNAGIDENGQRRMYFTTAEGALFETNVAPAEGDKIYGAVITNDTGDTMRAIKKYHEPIDLVESSQVHVVEDLSFPVTFAEAEAE